MKAFPSLSLVAVISLSLLLFSSCKKHPPQPGASKIEYAKEAVFPKVEGVELGIYERPRDFKLTREEGERLLNRLSELSSSRPVFTVNNEMRSEGETWFNSVQDPSVAARINERSGDVLFNAGMMNYRGDNPTPGLLRADAAQQRAQEYLRRLELPINERELVVAHLGGVNLGIHEEDRTQVVEKFTVVRFDRQFDNIPVYGHSRIVLQLAEEGRLNAFTWQWPPFNKRRISREHLRTSTDEMKAELERAVLGENTDTAKIRIESIQLIYFDDGRGTVEPALRVKGKTIHEGKERQEFPYDTVIPLLKSPQAKYPFQHRVEKQPNAIDNPNEARQMPRGPDEGEQR
jgi:hypothetical protein